MPHPAKRYHRPAALICLWMAACFFPLSAGGSLAAADDEPGRPPNILFIMADDLGREWIGCYGSESIETPAIDRLAKQGMRFENFYVMPQCTPTRVALLTGQYPFRNGWVNHWDVPRWGSGCHFDWRHYTTFARLLREAGYRTAAAGKWQINDFRVQPDAMRRHGFDDWCMWTGYESNNPPSAERYWDPYINTPEGSKTHAGAFGETVFTDFLIDFMRRHRDEPMMLYFPMALPHTPFTTTPLEPDAAGRMERHKAMVRYLDHCVGRLLDAVDELELADNTLVIFTTDNGTVGGVPGRLDGRNVNGAKARTNEAGTRMPFIVRGPGRVPEGVVTEELGDISDMLPTFLDLAGVELPPGLEIDGRSLAPLLLGETEQGPREWVLSMGHGAAAFDRQGVRGTHEYFPRVIRDKRYKLSVGGGRGPRPAALYDLQQDPWEERNLIDSREPEHAAARERLMEVVRALPQQDARPRYDPTPPQAWDRHPGWSEPGFRPRDN